MNEIYKIEKKSDVFQITPLKSKWSSIIFVLSIFLILLMIFLLSRFEIRLLLALVCISSTIVFGLQNKTYINHDKLIQESSIYNLIKWNKTYSLSGATSIDLKFKSFMTGPVKWYEPANLSIVCPTERVPVLFWKAGRKGGGISSETWLTNAKEIGKQLSVFLDLPMTENLEFAK